MADLAVQVLNDIERPQASAHELYVEGLGRLLENTSEDDYDDLKQMMKVVEEREKFSSFLHSEKITDLEKSKQKVKCKYRQ